VRSCFCYEASPQLLCCALRKPRGLSRSSYNLPATIFTISFGHSYCRPNTSRRIKRQILEPQAPVRCHLGFLLSPAYFPLTLTCALTQVFAERSFLSTLCANFSPFLKSYFVLEITEFVGGICLNFMDGIIIHSKLVVSFLWLDASDHYFYGL